MRRNRKQQGGQPTRICKMHARSIVLTQTITNYGIQRRLVTQIRTLPIYTSRSYDQGFHNALNVVSFLQKNTEYITTSGPFVPALTNGPHVSYATRVTYMQFPTYSHIHYHRL